MKWSAEIKSPKPLRFIIEKVQLHNAAEHEAMTGFYLHVYENDRCTYDYLQDTLEIAKKQALEDFGALKECWTQAEND